MLQRLSASMGPLRRIPAPQGGFVYKMFMRVDPFISWQGALPYAGRIANRSEVWRFGNYLPELPKENGIYTALMYVVGFRRFVGTQRVERWTRSERLGPIHPQVCLMAAAKPETASLLSPPFSLVSLQPCAAPATGSLTESYVPVCGIRWNEDGTRDVEAFNRSYGWDANTLFAFALLDENEPIVGEL